MAAAYHSFRSFREYYNAPPPPERDASEFQGTPRSMSLVFHLGEEKQSGEKFIA